MGSTIRRRDFIKTIGLAGAMGAFPLLAQKPKRRLKIGYTCITWRTFPPRGTNPDSTLDAALKDINSEGFWGFETFPEVLENWDNRGELKALMERYPVPLISGYMVINVLDPAAAKECLVKVQRMGKILRQYGGRYCVMQVDGVKRDQYNFADHRSSIISGLNDAAMAFADLGLGSGLHQHTGTAVETSDEVYTVMHAVNKYVKFAPDIGQLQKGGSDPVKVAKDFLPILDHMHLKDYKGWNNYVGYCPLGEGQVNIPAILDMVEASGHPCDVMVELDPSPNAPQTPLETVQTSKAYLQKLGYQFRS